MEKAKQYYKDYIRVLESILEEFSEYDETMISKDVQDSQIRVKAMLVAEIKQLSARL